MTDYAIGDIQGCYSTLKALLAKADFSPSRDHLIVLGDLVSRGPSSLDTLLFLRSLENSATILLGNHDLSLMTQVCKTPPRKPHPSCLSLVEAPEFHSLMDWMRQGKLALADDQRRILMTHAGLPPIWTPEECLEHAKEVETALMSTSYKKMLKKIYSDKPAKWDPELTGNKRLRCIINYLTRMRFCDQDGKLEFETKAGMSAAPEGYSPWFCFHPKKSDWKVLFGHWASLCGQTTFEPRINALDTGCVWGGELTMMDLDSFERVSVPNAEG